LGGAFYTINNGNSWANFPVSSLPYEQQFKLVGNYIYVIETEFTYKFARRNILTNEVEVVEFKNLYNFNGYQIAIQDDGTIYFYGWDPTSVLPEGIFRFRFGQELEPLPLLESMAGQDLFESGPYLYTFTSTSYKVYDGATLQSYPITGLPSSSSTKFLIAANEHLMAIVNNNRIFRSKQPLSFSVGTKDIPPLAAFDLFPNPTNSILHISLSDFALDRVDAFEISDINGRILFNGAFKENEIDVAALQPGIYNLILLKDKIIAGQKKFSKF
jgi:hypothetical protein